MYMKIVKVEVLRITYHLSQSLGASVTFKNNHVCHQDAIIRKRNMSFVSSLLQFIEQNIKEALNAIKYFTTFPLRKG